MANQGGDLLDDLQEFLEHYDYDSGDDLTSYYDSDDDLTSNYDSEDSFYDSEDYDSDDSDSSLTDTDSDSDSDCSDVLDLLLDQI